MDSSDCFKGLLGLDAQLNKTIEQGMFLSLRETLENIHYPFLLLIVNNLKHINNSDDQTTFLDIQAKIIRLNKEFSYISSPKEKNNKVEAETTSQLSVIKRLKEFLVKVEKLQAIVMDMHRNFIFQHIRLEK